MLERSDELGVLREKARSALGGSPQFVVIEGPAGIGRTSLLDEFVAESTMRPLRARCDELARGLDYGVVRQLFEPLVLAPDPCLVAQNLYTLTVDAAPVLLAVDDVHVADEPSLRLLRYLTKRLVDVPVLMVLTRRTGRHQAALNDLVLHPGCTVVRPKPLEVASTAVMLGEPPAELVRACHELTAGNPLLTRALGLSLATWDGAVVGGPPKTAVRVLSDIVRTWLSELSTDAQEFAQAFAVLGDVGDLRLLARLAGMDPTRGATACDELWQAGFVHAEPVPRWTRPFVRETVLTAMSTRRRQDLHAAAARLLDATGAPAHRVCAHLLQSPPAGDPWVVRALCSHATRSAPDLAATYLERALAEPPPERERVAVLVALGVAESKPKTGPVRRFAEHVIDKAAAQFAAGIERHPNLALLTDDSRHLAADAMRDRMRQALTDEFANLQHLDSSAAGKGWLTGARLAEFTKDVADRLATQPPLDTPVAVDPAKLADVAEHEVFSDAVKETVADFRGKDLVNTTPDGLKSLVATEVLPKLPAGLAAALRDHPAMSLVDSTFRDTMAGTVALDAQSRASAALTHFTVDPVDPAEVDAFMAKVPAIATQAEIGSVISTDSDQIAQDPRTRAQDGEPFLNTYHRWNVERGRSTPAPS